MEEGHSPVASFIWPSRFVLLGLVGLAALVLAGRSFGAVTPHMVVTSSQAGPGQTLSILASRQKTDDPVGRVQFVMPTGFGLDAPAVGKPVGKASATVVLRDKNPNAPVFMRGTVTAIQVTDPRVSYETSTCDGNTHAAAWMVNLKSSQGSLSFPIFVDATSGATASFGPYVLVTCFKAGDTPTTDPNRAAGGAIVNSFALALKPFARPTVAGDYRWRSLWTPYTPGTDTLNTAGNVEVQSVITIPEGQIVIFGKKSNATQHGKHVVKVLITGQVLVGSEPVGPGIVTIRHGSSPTKLVSLGGAKTGTNGGYTKFAVLSGKHEYFQASTFLAPKDLGSSGCQASFPNVPCVDATAGSGRVISGVMLVKH
jgi:hypothetical protein